MVSLEYLREVVKTVGLRSETKDEKTAGCMAGERVAKKAACWIGMTVGMRVASSVDRVIFR